MSVRPKSTPTQQRPMSARLNTALADWSLFPENPSYGHELREALKAEGTVNRKRAKPRAHRAALTLLPGVHTVAREAGHGQEAYAAA